MVTLMLRPSQPPRIISNSVCSCCLLIRTSYRALATWTLPGVTRAFSQHGNWPSPEECDEVISNYNTPRQDYEVYAQVRRGAQPHVCQ